MGRWLINKQFDFCYGHRVHNQNLNSEYSLDSCLACRHLHGHQGIIKVFLSSEQLIDGMVTDFKHLNWFKKWLDDVLDHKFIMDINDPLLKYEAPILFDTEGQIDSDFLEWNSEGYGIIPSSVLISLENCLIEKFEGMVFVRFVPTSENLSKWLLDIVTQRMKSLSDDITVHKIEFNETPKSQAIYEA